MNKKTGLIFILLTLPFLAYSQKRENYIIDSAYIKINNKVVLNNKPFKDYSDSIILFRSGDTIVRLLKPTKVILSINGIISQGKRLGGGGPSFAKATFEDGNGNKIYIRTNKKGISGIPLRDIMAYVIPTIFIFSIILFLINLSYKNRPKRTPNPKREDGDEIVKNLERLGYFNLTSSSKLSSIKKEMADTFNIHNILITNEILDPEEEEDSSEDFDYRTFSCDGEEQYEEEGFSNTLERIKPSFNKRNLYLEWKDEKHIKQKDTHTTSIILNNIQYIYSYKDNDTENHWEMAVSNFCKMINDQLLIQKSNEKLYYFSSIHDGQMILLTNEQFRYLKSIKLNGEIILP